MNANFSFFLKVGRAARKVHSLISVLCIAIVIFRIVCVIQCDCLHFVIKRFWILIIIFKQFHFHLLIGHHDCTIESHTSIIIKRTTRLSSFLLLTCTKEEKKLTSYCCGCFFLLSRGQARHAWKKIFAQDFSLIPAKLDFFGRPIKILELCFLLFFSWIN